MSSNTNNPFGFPFGGPPPFGPPPPPPPPPPPNNAAPSDTAPPTTTTATESEAFADIDVIFYGIKEDIDDLLSSLQQYARKRGDDDLSVGLSRALDVKHYLQRQQDLAGCLMFIREHGKGMEEMARSMFAEDAARWDDDDLEDVELEESEEGVQGEEGSGDEESEDDTTSEQEESEDEREEDAQGDDEEEFVATEEEIIGVRRMQAAKAMGVDQRLQTLQDNLLRDIPLLSEEERAHRVTCGVTWMDGDHWYMLVETRLKGEKHWG